MNVSILAGAQAPERLRVTIANAPLDPNPLDLTLVTSVALSVTKPDGSVEAWAMTATTQTVDLLVVERVWLITDVFTPGLYGIHVNLAVSGGVRRAGPTVLEVL